MAVAKKLEKILKKYRRGIEWEYEADYDLPPPKTKEVLSHNDTIKQILSLVLEEIKELLPKQVSTRTWGKFFKTTSYENKNDTHSIDIKCAYTNGYNLALDEVLNLLSSLEQVKEGKG